MKKHIAFTLVFSLFLASNVFATCPACVIAAGAGLGLGRELGLTDQVIGVLVGIVLLLSSMWLANVIIKKYKLFPIGRLVHIISFIAHFSTIYFLYHYSFIIYGFNTIFGYDSFLLGSVIGVIIAYLQHRLYIHIKKNNNNKPHFPYEKIVILVITILLTIISVSLFLK